MDFRCQKDNQLSINKDKKYKTTRADKAKSQNLFPNTSQTQSQASKKNKHHRSRQGHLTAGINAIEVLKKNKDKNKDKKSLSHIECYTYK